ncbi:MAG: aldehyde dehydrogenase family protein [Bryobacteraceae bacterium]|nr:aldehyde dehydrogenase family protein [Bryobacteraceae bacterium]
MLHDQDLLSIQEVRTKVEKAWSAWQTFRTFTQAQVDAIVERMGEAGRAHAVELARMAVEETGYGNVQDKTAKNLLCAELLPKSIRSMKTVGVIRELAEERVTEIGVPMGVVAAICPTTNPTSTAIYKSIISLKAGNGVVLSPHPRAKKCTCYTASLMLKAAVEAGAPDGIIQCLENPSIEATNVLMRHERTAVILSTGGSGIVRAAYSSGKPAFGVGPGNVPVLVDESCDMTKTIMKVVAGKSFDYGTVCSSEQTVVAVSSLRPVILEHLQKNNAYLCNDEQRKALEKLLITHNFGVNPKCVGQSPQKIAEMAGFSVPAEARILCCEIGGVGKEHPLSAEKLSPVLSLLFVPDFAAALDACEGILRFGGLGHTCVIHAKDEAHIHEYARRMPAFRVLVNTSSPQGSTGITTNIQPSMTLGCGAVAGNSTSDNVGPQHLINVKRLARSVRLPQDALQVPTVSETKAAVLPAPSPAVAAPAATPNPGAAAFDREAIVSAVERYLAQRGVKVNGSGAPLPAARPASVTEGVVDRFLRSRSKPAAPTAGACCVAPTAAQAAAVPAGAPAPPPPAPAPAPAEREVTIVDFVCEADVRAAIAQSRKIYIGPKTIVTPAAREAARDETLVMAQRT